MRALCTLLLVALFVTHVPSASAAIYAEKVQPVLLQLAAEQPEEDVRIIVQKRTNDTSAEEIMRGHEGRVVRDLNIINAFVAELPAQKIPLLGRSADVRWISLDAEVVESGQLSGNQQNVRDNFINASYSGNSGSQAWLDSWTEIGEDDGSELGDVRVTRFLAGTKQGLRIQNSNVGIERSADLSRANSATLAFSYRRKGLDSDSDFVTVQVSNDDGVSWSEVGRLAGPGTDEGLEHAAFDVSAFMSARTVVRFMSSDTLNERTKVYVDDVNISYTMEQAEGVRLNPAVFLPFAVAQNSPNAASESGSVSAASVNLFDFVTARDEFNSATYNNNDGTAPWASAWVETNDEGLPTAGNISIVEGSLRIQNKSRGIVRKIDLSHATLAILTFDIHQFGMNSAADYVAVEIIRLGEPNWTELARFGPAYDYYANHAYFDISPFISKDTLIRFVASDSLDTTKGLLIDNVEIEHDGMPVQNVIGEAVTVNVPVVKDTYIFEYRPNNNYGHAADLRSKYSTSDKNRRILLQYAVPEALRGCTVASAKAHFFDTNDKGNRLSVHRVLQDWGEYSATWNHAPAFSAAPESFFHTNHAAHVDVNAEIASIVQAWLDGEPNFGILLETISTSGTGDLMSSRENVNGHAPYLTIDAICSAPVLIGTTELYEQGIDGSGITVAVVDSGISMHDDFLDEYGGSRILYDMHINDLVYTDDSYGHGTHVAGTIAGNGFRSGGTYTGVAPNANLLDVKVTDDFGAGSTSDVVAGLEWILDHKEIFNIRVVNVSLNSSVAESYHVSPLDAALEILWFNEIVVVVSAGNNGALNNGVLFPPANDPFLIAVGASDDHGTVPLVDNVVAPFSAYGITSDGFSKPDIIAPGVDIISVLASDDCNLALAHPAHLVSGPGGNDYFRMSGTSMASAVVAGAVALLLQDEPHLTPDQVKHRLVSTARRDWPHYNPLQAGAGIIDIRAAVYSTDMGSANTDIKASMLLWTGSDPVTWGSVNWGSVNWGSVNWGSVNWGSVNWGSVNWGSVHWDD